MALYTYHHDAPIVTAAGRRWVERCLVNDGSILSDEHLTTVENLAALDHYFVKQPDAGEGGFYEKLKGQLAGAPADATKLMAELLWALFLFPSNLNEETKREGVMSVWSWSGQTLDPANPMLDDKLLDGIGSGGMGVNTNRWRELNYIIGLARAAKRIPQMSRADVFADYDRFMAWMSTVPPEGNRQFRHMLRYFLFPERVERMSSNGDRYRVLDGFGVAKPKVMRRWSDVQLDDAMLKLRRELEHRYGSQDIDFYLPPLRSQWMSENESDDPAPETEVDKLMVAEDPPPYRPSIGPRNLILYGPPGTGKTWRLQKMFVNYTDQAADVDLATWEVQLVAKYGWRAVIAAALAEMKGPAKVSDLLDHPLIKVKAIQRKRSGPVRATVWGYMQEHTPFASTTVNTAIRRAPFIFDKTDGSEWYLTPDWREADDEASELSAAWRAGPGGAGKAVQRYRVVTFHPSYSYEDFVLGLRPVVLEDGGEDGRSGFRMVDGVFKQICAEARANPAKRYALFIDEINRANIAKVFGELITLVEPDKRARYDAEGNLVGGMEVQLPGTGVEDGEAERFGVPENLDIYGTMNTADRSIALLDIALRRRFEFEEIPPEYGVLDRRVEGVDLGRLLMAINNRLEFLADRDRRIGHAYFTRVGSLDDLRMSFRRQVIPLLQEYFFDDWSRVALVLAGRNGRSTFVRRELLDGGKLFGDANEIQQQERFRHEVTAENDWTAEAFQSIYQDAAVPSPAAE